LMLFENYWKRNICLWCFWCLWVFCSYSWWLLDPMLFIPPSLHSNHLGMPWNAFEWPILGWRSSVGSNVQVIADSELNLEKLDVMNSFFAARYGTLSLHWVHKSATLLIIPAMQMSLMGSTTTRCCCSLLNHCSCLLF
jgi:hypothetical protein